MTVSYAVFRRWSPQALEAGADRLHEGLLVLDGCADDVTVGQAQDWRGWAADAAAQRRRELAQALRGIGEEALALRRSLHRGALELSELHRLDTDLRADVADCGAVLTDAGAISVPPGGRSLDPGTAAALTGRLESLLARAEALDTELAAAARRVTAGLRTPG